MLRLWDGSVFSSLYISFFFFANGFFNSNFFIAPFFISFVFKFIAAIALSVIRVVFCFWNAVFYQLTNLDSLDMSILGKYCKK